MQWKQREGKPQIEPKRNAQYKNKTKQNAATEMKNAFGGLIRRLDMAEEIICELKAHKSAIS